MHERARGPLAPVSILSSRYKREKLYIHTGDEKRRWLGRDILEDASEAAAAAEEGAQVPVRLIARCKLTHYTRGEREREKRRR